MKELLEDYLKIPKGRVKEYWSNHPTGYSVHYITEIDENGFEYTWSRDVSLEDLLVFIYNKKK